MTWPLISGGVSEKGDFAKRQLLKDGVWTVGSLNIQMHIF